VTGSGAGRLLAAAGAPLLAAVLWALFAAPAAPVQVLAVTVLVKVLVYGSAGAALVAAGALGSPWSSR
jgi:Protein of unknown function (DUF2568)